MFSFIDILKIAVHLSLIDWRSLYHCNWRFCGFLTFFLYLKLRSFFIGRERKRTSEIKSSISHAKIDQFETLSQFSVDTKSINFFHHGTNNNQIWAPQCDRIRWRRSVWFDSPTASSSSSPTLWWRQAASFWLVNDALNKLGAFHLLFNSKELFATPRGFEIGSVKLIDSGINANKVINGRETWPSGYGRRLTF